MQRWIRLLKSLKVVSDRRILELYPPFLFHGVKVVEVSPDHRETLIRVPLRWYFRNTHGSMFGGTLCAVADPFPAVMLEKIFKGVEVWSQRNSVTFLRPTRTAAHARVRISDEDIEVVTRELREKGRCLREFYYAFEDSQGNRVAEVANTVFLKYRKKRALESKD